MDNMAGMHGMHDWQWMFLIEAAPAVLLGIGVLFYLDNRIDDARWLTLPELAALRTTDGLTEIVAAAARELGVKV
jgi:hypothetical protein